MIRFLTSKRKPKHFVNQRWKTRPRRQRGPRRRWIRSAIDDVGRGARCSHDASPAADSALNNRWIAAVEAKCNLAPFQRSEPDIFPNRRGQQSRIRKTSKWSDDRMPVLKRVKPI